MVHELGNRKPRTEKAAFIAWNAEVVGDAELGQDCGVWYSATIRADMAPVTVGERSNIQDGAVLHVDHDTPLSIGSGVTVGHNAILHGCTIEDDCLIGMGAIVLNNARIGAGSVVGAGALVTEGKEFPPRSLIVGSPARVLRQVDEDMFLRIRRNAEDYVAMAREHAASGKNPR